MSSRHFMDLLRERWAQGLFVSVGLDSDYPKIRPYVDPFFGITLSIYNFNEQIIGATHDLAGAFKPQKSFYEAQGRAGLQALRQTIALTNDYAPYVPVILDAKVGDIGNSNLGYLAMLDHLGADAITVHPYLGREALQPFLDRPDKGVIVLCRTSNPSAKEFQNREIWIGWDELKKLCIEDPYQLACEFGWTADQGLARLGFYGTHAFVPIYQYVALRVARVWNTNNNCALVVGATCPEELAKVRRLVGDLPILIPGIGAQGGDLEKTVKAGMDSQAEGMIINSSRAVIFAGRPGTDFGLAARDEVVRMNHAIDQHRLVIA